MAIIGIDLGTTNSLVTAYKEGQILCIPNALGEELTPSVVSFREDSTILVGESAKERLVSHLNPLFQHSKALWEQNILTASLGEIGQHQNSPPSF